MTRSLALCSSLFLIVSPMVSAETAFAQKPSADLDARQIIERQLAAFERDDAAEAFSYATPEIQAQFPDPTLFLDAIADAFPAARRHRNVEFGPTAEEEGAVAEAVIVTDDDGQVWNAIYKLEKEPQGSWRISGVVLEKSDQKAI